MKIGAYIRQSREALGLSQSYVCGQTDLTPSMMSGIESGSRLPSITKVNAIAKALAISPDYLCYLLGYFPEAERSGERMGPDEFAARMAVFRVAKTLDEEKHDGHR